MTNNTSLINFEAIKTGNDSVFISNGTIIKGWDFAGKEIAPCSMEVFKCLKLSLTFEKIAYKSFEEAKNAFDKHWNMLTLKNAPYYKLNRIT